jgi:hypothetical protein
VISYGVYLFHWPIVRWLDQTTVPVDGVGLFVLRSAVTLVAATASFHLVERPLQRVAPSRRTDPTTRPRRWTAPVLAVVAVLLVGACGVVAAPTERSPLSGPPISADATLDPAPSASTDLQSFARVVQLPPAAGSWLPIDQADALGELFFINSCFRGLPLVSERDNGTGDRVAVIGDSITTEIVSRLLDDPSHDWLVVSMCGLALNAMDPADPFHGEMLAAVDRVVASGPRSIVIAFTTSGASSTVDDVARDLDALLARTASVPCQLVMNAHPNPEMDRASTRGASSGLVTLNEALSAPGHERLTLLDWDASVDATPVTADGYHPFLDPSDWLHLVPDQGDRARIALMKAGVETCSR